MINWVGTWEEYAGVESVTLAGGDKNLLLVIGDDVDSNTLTKSLEKKVGVCRRRRRSSAYVAGVVTEHDATSVNAPGRVRGLGHGRDDDNDRSCNNSGDSEIMV